MRSRIVAPDSRQGSFLRGLYVVKSRTFDQLSDDLSDSLQTVHAHLEPGFDLFDDPRHVSKLAAGQADNKRHRPSGHCDPLLKPNLNVTFAASSRRHEARGARNPAGS